MRRHDKRLWMEHVNKKFQKHINEGMMSLGDDIENIPMEEHHGGDFPMEVLNMTVDTLLDDLKNKDQDGYELMEKIIKANYGQTEQEPAIDNQTDMKDGYWFSDEDAMRVTDRNLDS